MTKEYKEALEYFEYLRDDCGIQRTDYKSLIINSAEIYRLKELFIKAIEAEKLTEGKAREWYKELSKDIEKYVYGGFEEIYIKIGKNKGYIK